MAVQYPVTNDFVTFEAVQIPRKTIEDILPLNSNVDLSSWAVGMSTSGTPIAKSNVESPMTNSNTTPVNLAETPETSLESPSAVTNIDTSISFEELAKQEKLPIKITSGFRGAGSLRGGKTKQGKRSNHNRRDASGNPMAYDIVPKNGDFQALLHAIYTNPRVVNWFKSRGWGILEETTSSVMKRTGATGRHLHIGPDTWARQMFQSRLNQYGIPKGQQGFKFMDYNNPFVQFEAVNVEKPKIDLPLLDNDFELPSGISRVTSEGNLVAENNNPMTNSNTKQVDTTQTAAQPDTTQTPQTTKNTSEKASIAMNFFQSKGLARHQAAGLVGNLIRESRLNHSVSNKSSGAVGIAQWLGSRKNKLFNTYGKNPSFEQQLEFIWQELNSSHKKGLQALLNSQTVDEAAANAFGYYEFNVGPKEAIATMRKHGQDGLGAYEKGLKFARELI